jgi:hypothetical protein
MRRRVTETLELLAADEVELVTTKDVTLTLKAGVHIIGQRVAMEALERFGGLILSPGNDAENRGVVCLCNFAHGSSK